MKSDRLFIRILEQDDIILTQKWITDSEISEIMGYLPVFSLAHQLNWYNSIKESNKTYIFAICISESKEHIGNVGLGNIDYVNRNCMLNIFIADKKYRGKGYGSEAVKLILNFAFNRLNMHKVYLQASENSAIKMYQKIGFIEDGVLREHSYFHGKYVDKHIFSIFQKEFN